VEDLEIDFTDDEYAYIKSAADAKGLTVEEFVRQTIEKYLAMVESEQNGQP
jgi:uncharacterized protein (DUF1778 family)